MACRAVRRLIKKPQGNILGDDPIVLKNKTTNPKRIELDDRGLKNKFSHSGIRESLGLAIKAIKELRSTAPI